MRRTKIDEPEEGRRKLSDASRTITYPSICKFLYQHNLQRTGLAEEDSGERKLPDKRLKARFTLRRKGSVSDMTSDGDEESSADELVGSQQPPVVRPFTVHGIPAGAVALHMMANSPSASAPSSMEDLPVPPDDMLPPPPPKKPETPFGTDNTGSPLLPHFS